MATRRVNPKVLSNPCIQQWMVIQSQRISGSLNNPHRKSSKDRFLLRKSSPGKISMTLLCRLLGKRDCIISTEKENQFFFPIFIHTSCYNIKSFNINTWLFLWMNIAFGTILICTFNAIILQIIFHFFLYQLCFYYSIIWYADKSTILVCP